MTSLITSNHEASKDCLTRLTEEEACKYFHQLISAVAYLHKIGCAHRDIKPSNILVDWKYNIKVIDFGLGNTYEENEKLKTACGSPCYAAPEIISGLVYDPMTIDIWSCGITLYTMVCGCLPFDEESKTALYDKILACKFQLPRNLSLEVCDLIRSILVKDVTKRPSIEQILQHPWMKTLNHDHSNLVDNFKFGKQRSN